jgi:hypothetical protein
MFPEITVDFQETAQCYIPEDKELFMKSERRRSEGSHWTLP